MRPLVRGFIEKVDRSSKGASKKMLISFNFEHTNDSRFVWHTAKADSSIAEGSRVYVSFGENGIWPEQDILKQAEHDDG